MQRAQNTKQIIAWLKERLDRNEPGKTRAALARALGKDRSAVTEILAGRRTITADAHAIMRAFFGEDATATEGLQRRELSKGIVVKGRVGENTWSKPSESKTGQRTVGVVTSDYPLDEQSAYEMGEPTPDGEYRAGDMIYVVPFENYRAKPLVDDVLLVELNEDGFRRHSLRRAVSAAKGIILSELVPEGTAPKPGARGEEIRGLMIGFYRPSARR